MWTAVARSQYERLNERYASDVTDDEYGLIEPLLPPARHGGRRRTTDLREMLNAILYLVRTGCQWRLLPKDFPPWSTVYGYFRRFWLEGIWHRIWMILLMQAREQDGKEASPTAGVVDRCRNGPASKRGVVWGPVPKVKKRAPGDGVR